MTPVIRRWTPVSAISPRHEQYASGRDTAAGRSLGKPPGVNAGWDGIDEPRRPVPRFGDPEVA